MWHYDVPEALGYAYLVVGRGAAIMSFGTYYVREILKIGTPQTIGIIFRLPHFAHLLRT